MKSPSVKNISLNYPGTKLTEILPSALQMSTELHYNPLSVESLAGYNTNEQSPRSHSFSSSQLDSPGIAPLTLEF